jgi:hypothetical protein
VEKCGGGGEQNQLAKKENDFAFPAPAAPILLVLVLGKHNSRMRKPAQSVPPGRAKYVKLFPFPACFSGPVRERVIIGLVYDLP